MKPHIFVRDLSEEEQKSLATGLRSSDAFVLRRSQILLASARGETAPTIAKALSCDKQTVHHAVHAFNQQGRAALQAGSSRPHHWTLELLVKQCVCLGWMARPVSIETMRQTLSRVGINWKRRAKRWLSAKQLAERICAYYHCSYEAHLSIPEKAS